MFPPRNAENGRRFEMLYICPDESGGIIFPFLKYPSQDWMESILKLQNCFLKKTYSLVWSGSRVGWIADGTFVDVVCFSEIRPSRHGINYVDDWPIWQQALSRPSGCRKI